MAAVVAVLEAAVLLAGLCAARPVWLRECLIAALFLPWCGVQLAGFACGPPPMPASRRHTPSGGQAVVPHPLVS